MRRLLRDIAAGKEQSGDTSTLENYTVFTKLPPATKRREANAQVSICQTDDRERLAAEISLNTTDSALPRDHTHGLNQASSCAGDSNWR